MSLKRKISVIWLLCLVQFSCEKLDNQKTCFLDFRLAMLEHEYEHLRVTYLRDGVMEERKYQEPSLRYERKALIYTFEDLSLQAIVNPSFLTDRMGQLRLFVGGNSSVLNGHPTMEEDFQKLVPYFESIYGKASITHFDSIRGHRQAYWEQPPDFNITLTYSPSSLDWEGNIGIYFTPKAELKEELERYNQEKEQLREQYNKEQQPTSATPDSSLTTRIAPPQ